MSYRLDLTMELPSTVRAAAREQLESGASVLGAGGGDRAEAVHSARKHVKKSRALLRLARPALGDKIYRRENRLLRDAARSVAHLRDADVMAETVAALHARFAGQLPATAFDEVQRALKQEAEASRLGADGHVGAELRQALATVASHVDEWPLDGAGWDVALSEIAVAYRRGRKAFARANRKPTVENLHEWRKRVKDLWYHERLLKPAWPAVLTAQAKEAHALSELLGDDHDLALLAERLTEETLSPEVDELLELIEQRRAELLAEIRSLGRRVYAEKPKAFARRIGRYVRSVERTQPVLA